MDAPSADGPAQDGSVDYRTRLHPGSRYVAQGDSFPEGVGDPEPRSPGGLRGWADRVAEELGIGQRDFAYANLAIRGCCSTRYWMSRWALHWRCNQK